MTARSGVRIAGALIFVAAVAAAWSHPALREVSLGGMQGRLAEARIFADLYPVRAAAYFFGAYVGISLLAIFPLAILFALLAGALFGWVGGTVLVCAASTAGATLSFGLARAIGREAVQGWLGERMRGIDAEVERDGGYYVFLLRLTPVVPFSVINFSLALTRIPARVFLTASFLGMLPSSAAFVNAGRELATIRSVADVGSPGLIVSLLVVGFLPLTLKKLLTARRRSPA